MVLEDTLLYSSELSWTASLAIIIPAVLIPLAIIIACFVLLIITTIYIFNRRAKRKENYQVKDEMELSKNTSYSMLYYNQIIWDEGVDLTVR